MRVPRRLRGTALALLLAATGGAAQASDAETQREGRIAFQVCKACHHFVRAKRKSGPHLVGLIGRPVAADKIYPYSDALRSLGGIWTEERLAAFLNDPAAFAPGNRMAFDGYRDIATARAVVAYIARIGG